MMAVSDARNDNFEIGAQQSLAIEIHWDEARGRHAACRGHDHGVDDARPEMLLKALDVCRGVVANRLVWLLEQVGHVDAAGT